MASATDLVSNRGDAALSQGSNPDIGIVTTPANSGYNAMLKVAENMMIRNHQFNKDMFEQKIKDRDELIKALNDGQVQSGKIDEADKPAYEKAKKEHDDAFNDFADNGGINNTEKYQNWIQKTTDLKNTSTLLQSRNLEITKQKQAISDEPIEEKKKEKQAYLDKQLARGSGATIMPFQTSVDFDADEFRNALLTGVTIGSEIPSMVTTSSIRTTTQAGKPPKVTEYTKKVPVTAGKGKVGQTIVTQGIAGNVPQGTSGVTAPKITYRNGLPYSVSSSYVDFNKIKQNANEQYLNQKSKISEYINQLYDKITDPNYLSHPEAIDSYDTIIKAAIDYNKARGFAMDEKYQVSPEDMQAGAADVQKLINGFNAPLDSQTGKRQINLTKPELAAYFTLAGVPSFATHTEKLLGEEAKLQLEKDKIKEDARQANMADKRLRDLAKEKGKTKEQLEQEMGNAYNEFVFSPASGGIGIKTDESSGLVIGEDGKPFTSSENGIKVNANDIPDGIKNLIQQANPEYEFGTKAKVFIKDGQVVGLQYEGGNIITRDDIKRYQVNEVSKFSEKGNPFIPHYKMDGVGTNKGGSAEIPLMDGGKVDIKKLVKGQVYPYNGGNYKWDGKNLIEQ